jgi:hypothetical protein
VMSLTCLHSVLAVVSQHVFGDVVLDGLTYRVH